jgi:hypothetical protein
MSLRGPIAKLGELAARLREIPRTVGAKIATAAASDVTARAQATFAAGEDAFGETWAPGSKGQKITLRRTGALAAFVRYVAIGTRLRVSLGVPYAKYQIGKRAIFPRGKIPVEYAQAIADVARETLRRELGGLR